VFAGDLLLLFGSNPRVGRKRRKRWEGGRGRGGGTGGEWSGRWGKRRWSRAYSLEIRGVRIRGLLGCFESLAARCRFAGEEQKTGQERCREAERYTDTDRVCVPVEEDT